MSRGGEFPNFCVISMKNSGDINYVKWFRARTSRTSTLTSSADHRNGKGPHKMPGKSSPNMIHALLINVIRYIKCWQNVVCVHHLLLCHSTNFLNDLRTRMYGILYGTPPQNFIFLTSAHCGIIMRSLVSVSLSRTNSNDVWMHRPNKCPEQFGEGRIKFLWPWRMATPVSYDVPWALGSSHRKNLDPFSRFAQRSRVKSRDRHGDWRRDHRNKIITGCLSL